MKKIKKPNYKLQVIGLELINQSLDFKSNQAKALKLKGIKKLIKFINQEISILIIKNKNFFGN